MTLGSTDEKQLWNAHLAVLQAGLSAGKPDAVQVAKQDIARLDREMSALCIRREICANAEAQLLANGDAVSPELAGKLAKLTSKIDEVAARDSAIRGMLRDLKLLPKQLDEGPTPEALTKPASRDPIGLLEELDRKRPGAGLTSDQARAAKQIADISEAMAKAGKAKPANLEAVGGAQGYREPEMIDRLAEYRTERYLPWVDHWNIRDRITLHICLNVAVHGNSINSLARTHRIRRDAVIDRLQRGLDSYWNHRELLAQYRERCERANRARVGMSAA